MENYFSQLLSRNAPSGPGLLQPGSQVTPTGKDGLEESFVEEPFASIESPAKAGDMIQPGFPGQIENDRQPNIEQKNIHHHYLQQYFTRVVSEEAEKKHPTASIIKQNEKQPSSIVPVPGISHPESLNEPEAQDTLRILSIKEVTDQKDLTATSSHSLLSADSESKTPLLAPAAWLLPSPPAVKAASLPAPSTNKPAPSLMIGKILIELLPAKPVPPRVINRSSPFQATAGKSGSSTNAFGLGQL